MKVIAWKDWKGGPVEDGMYAHVPFEVYSAGKEWEARMSPHVLEQAIEGTMAHVKAAFYGIIPDKDSSAYAFGRALHCRLLEPDRFRDDFAVAQQCCQLTNNGKGSRCTRSGAFRIVGQWYCSQHSAGGETEPVEAITEGEAEAIEGMRSRVMKHPALRLLRQAGPSELSIAWTCPRTGIKGKTRLDKWIPELVGGGSCILDLKSCESASERFVANALEKYGWARAGAMRQDAVEALTGTRPDYYLICIEKQTPYEMCVPRIGESTERGAKYEVRSLMTTWNNCVKKNEFPGFGNDFIDIDVPAWKLKEYQATVPGDYQ